MSNQLGNNRLISLDALRGYTVAAMVIVNSPGSWGSVYNPFLHASWHGITPTDLVFPFFLFIVGVSIALAYSPEKLSQIPRTALIKRVAVRAAKIMLLGWFLTLFPSFNFENMRFAGVLPRISLVFLFCGVIYLTTSWKQQLTLASIILIGYWIFMAFVPVPIDEVVKMALEHGEVRAAHGMRQLGELTKISDQYIAPNYEPGVNITAWFDRKFLPGRFYEKTWDPEGLISTLPAIATGLIGMLMGQFMRAFKESYQKVSMVFFAGFVLYLVGTMWGWIMPLNKNLWTSSYVLVTSGHASMGLGAFMLIVDVMGYSQWTRLGRVYGANAITAFVLSGLMLKIFYNDIFFGRSLNGMWMEGLTNMGLDPRFASLSYAVLYMYIVYVPVYFMYKKKIFLKV